MQTGEWEIRGFSSYFGHRVSFLLAPRARKKRALTVAAFTVILSLEIYIYLTSFFLYYYILLHDAAILGNFYSLNKSFFNHLNQLFYSWELR